MPTEKPSPYEKRLTHWNDPFLIAENKSDIRKKKGTKIEKVDDASKAPFISLIKRQIVQKVKSTF